MLQVFKVKTLSWDLWDKGSAGGDQHCAGANGLSHPPCLGGKEIQGMLWPLSFHLREICSSTQFCVVGSGPLPHGAESLA